MAGPVLHFHQFKHQRTGRFLLPSLLATQMREEIVARDDVVPGMPTAHSVIMAPNTAEADMFGYFSTLPPEVIASVSAGTGILVIDASNEGAAPNSRTMRALHAKLDELHIKPSRVAYITQNLCFAEDYNAWAQRAHVADRMVVHEYHYFLKQMALFVEQQMIPSGLFAKRLETFNQGERERPFDLLTLNFTPRSHRVAFMLWLFDRGYIDRSIVSFPGLKNRKYNIEDRVDAILAKSPWPEIARLAERLPELASRTPMTLDADPFVRISPVVDVGSDRFYEDSYFSVVTESGIESTGERGLVRFERFTEKPFKPMLGLHPFLIVGLPHTLRHLKRYGFETFWDVLDETYDTIANDLERMTCLTAEIDRLMSLDDAAKINLRQRSRDVLLHNYMMFDGPIQRHFIDDIERPLLAALLEQANQPNEG